MAEIRYNNQGGQLGAVLSPSGTVITFQNAPNFATLSGGDYITICLDAGLATFEILHLTAYTAGALTGTVTRAAEDGTNWPAVAHSSGWACMGTVADFTAISGVQSVNAGTNVTITGTPTNPIVNSSGGGGSGTVTSVSNVDGTVVVTGTPTVAPVVSRAALTGDVTASAGSNATVLKNTGPGATGPIGDATHVSTVTIDAQGRVTALTSTAITAGGSGTVTSASVVTANGFGGTVATPTSTPAITITTGVTGLLKGNGTGVVAATAGTDYLTILTGDVTTSGNAATLKNTGPGATGPIGSTSVMPVITIDAQGRVTALTSTAVVTGVSSVTATDATIVVGGTAAAPTIQRAALTGDVTTALNVATLATVATAGTTGDASHVNQATIDAKGRVTTATAVAIQIAESAVTNLVTDLAGKTPLAISAVFMAANFR